MSLRIRFDADLTTSSDKGKFPADTIAAVYITNRDGCTHLNAPVSDNGHMSVDFVMEPKSTDVKLTDRVKFHFYFRDNDDGMLKPVCAGHMTLVELADRVKDGLKFETTSNFTTNVVCMRFRPNEDHSRGMHTDLLRLYNTNAVTPSVLSQNKKYVDMITKLDASITSGLDSNTVITSDNGGHMFQSVLTAHIMENEATIYTMYHHDFDEPEAVPPWLCTYLLAETLHTNAVTPEQVKAMPIKDVTNFISSYAQAPMRSASAVPYTPDLTLTDDPAEYTKKRTMLSEIFKRPYSHPHAVLNGYGTLQTDDCEGLAVTIQNLTNHLGYVYEKHNADFNKEDAYLPYNNLMKRYFPKKLFCGMSTQYQNKLMDMALFLGQHVSKKTIECKITLVTANGASMGDKSKTQIQGHACASMVCNDPNNHHVVMLEGTACTTDDQDPRRIRLGGHIITLADVANSLSCTEPFNRFTSAGLQTRVAVHLTHSHGSFYRTAFCQNESMLGSQIGEGRLTYGVDMEYLGDESIKVYMPMTGKALEPGELDQLKQYIRDRRAEIHPPLVDHDELRESMNWVPIEPFKGFKELEPNRSYMTCMVHVLANEKHPLATLLAAATAEANAFNAEPKNLKIGAMRAFACMDGVTKLFHFYTDDTALITKRLGLGPPNQTVS